MHEASDINWLKKHRITHIVNCAFELPEYHRDAGIKYISLKLNDIPNQPIYHTLEPSHSFIKSAASKRGKILVHCAAGISRSASIVIYHLMKTYKITYNDALNMLRQVRPIVNPNNGFEKQLIVLEKSDGHQPFRVGM